MVRVPTGQVFDDLVVVFATDSYSMQAVLSSNCASTLDVTYGSTLSTHFTNYTPSACFETLPLPSPAEWLEHCWTLDEERRTIMLRRRLGLTRLYNVVHDPEISLGRSADADVARVRAMHVELDHAVMDAYGWCDVGLDHGFHRYRQMVRWTVSPAARVEDSRRSA